MDEGQIFDRLRNGDPLLTDCVTLGNLVQAGLQPGETLVYTELLLWGAANHALVWMVNLMEGPIAIQKATKPKGISTIKWIEKVTDPWELVYFLLNYLVRHYVPIAKKIVAVGKDADDGLTEARNTAEECIEAVTDRMKVLGYDTED